MSGIWDPKQGRCMVRPSGKSLPRNRALAVGSGAVSNEQFKVISRSQAREVLADMGIRDAEDQELIMDGLQNMTNRANSYEYDRRTVISAGKVFLGAQQRQAAQEIKDENPPVENLSRGELLRLAQEQGVSAAKVDNALSTEAIAGAHKEGNQWVIPYAEAVVWVNANAAEDGE